jgi:hypothetical protein
MHLSSEERGQPSSRCGEAVKAMVHDVVGPDRTPSNRRPHSLGRKVTRRGVNMDSAMHRSLARKLGIVFLVLVVLVLGIPLAMPMGSGACPECPGQSTGSLVGVCVAILAGLLLLALAAGSTALTERAHRGSRVLAHSFERPPRSA